MSAHVPQRRSGGARPPTAGSKSATDRPTARPTQAVSAVSGSTAPAPFPLAPAQLPTLATQQPRGARSSSGDSSSDEESGDADSDEEDTKPSATPTAYMDPSLFAPSASDAAAPSSADVDELVSSVTSSMGLVQLDQPAAIELDEPQPFVPAPAVSVHAPTPGTLRVAQPVTDTVPPANAKPVSGGTASAVAFAALAATSTTAAPAPTLPFGAAATRIATAGSAPRLLPFPKPLANPLQLPQTHAIGKQPAAAPPVKLTQPKLPPEALKDNPYASSSVALIDLELRKQSAFLASSASLLAALPDKGAALKLRVAQLEQALPLAQEREEAQKANVMQYEATPPPSTALLSKPAAGSLHLQGRLPASATPSVPAPFGSAPQQPHALFGGGAKKVQSLSLSDAADYMPHKGKKPQHGFYGLSSSSSSTGGSTGPSKADALDEGDLMDLLNSLNRLHAGSGPAQPTTHRLAAPAAASAHSTAASASPAVPAPPPALTIPGLNPSTRLLPHQLQAVEWMITRESGGSEPRGGLVADDCGLGKSLQMLALILWSMANETNLPVIPKHAPTAASNSTKSSSSTGASTSKPSSSAASTASAAASSSYTPSLATLIVCPKAVLNSWRMEIDKHVNAGFLNARGKPLRVLTYHGTEKGAWSNSALLARKADLVLTTYETVLRDPSPKECSDPEALKHAKGEFGLMGVVWRRVVLDESHSIRNPATEKARVLATLLEAERRWAMSGTPLQNHVDDLYSTFWFLRFQPYADKAKWKSLVSRHPGGERRGKEVLKTLLSVVAIRRSKGDASPLDGRPLVSLPPKTFTVHRLDFTPQERDFYEELWAAYREEVMESFGERVVPFAGKQQQQQQQSSQPGKPKPIAPPAGGGAASTLLTRASQSHLRMSDLLVKLLRLRQSCDHFLLAIEGMRASAASAAAKGRIKGGKEQKDRKQRHRAKREERRMEEVLEHACAKIHMRLQRENLPGNSAKSPISCVSSSEDSSDSDSSSSSDDDDEDASCGICLDALPSRPSLILTAKCAHRFCLPCLKPLLEDGGGATDCPRCERTIRAKDFGAKLEQQQQQGESKSAAKGTGKGTKSGTAPPADVSVMDYVSSFAPAATAASPSPAAIAAAPDLLSTAKLSFLLRSLRALKRSPPTAGDKVIVFSQWTSMLDLVQLALDREQEKADMDVNASTRISFGYTRLDGGQSSIAQHASLVRFATDPSVSIFLLSLAAGGTGLTLTAANHLFLLDLWWNPGVEAQAFDRVYRVGQTKPVHIHKLLIRDSVEEALYDMQQRKLAMAQGVMDAERRGAGASAGTSSAQSGLAFKRTATAMSMADLRELFLAKPNTRR